MSDLAFSVKCKRKVRSAFIRDGVVMVDLGLELGFRLLTVLPEDMFKLVAENQRAYRDSWRREYNMQDGRNVCKYIQGKEVEIRFTGRDAGDRIWRDAEIIGFPQIDLKKKKR